MKILYVMLLTSLLTGCITAPPKEAAKPTLLPKDATYNDLVALPSPRGKIYVSVYNIQDETGQFQPYPASNFSTAVPQSATAMLVSSLKASNWFYPLERQGLNNLLNERKIIRAAQENGTVAENNRAQLPSLMAANILIEGSIIGYASNVKSGGIGARYFGIGGSTQYQLDQIAVNLRVVDVKTGEILSSVNTTKTILSYEVQAGVFRFIDYQRLLEGEIGFTTNEPVMTCLMAAIESGVIHLINDGIERNLWALQNVADANSPVLSRYRAEAREGTTISDEALADNPPLKKVTPDHGAVAPATASTNTVITPGMMKNVNKS
jgi:curli production assembly/transport component CsgG